MKIYQHKQCLTHNITWAMFGSNMVMCLVKFVIFTQKL